MRGRNLRIEIARMRLGLLGPGDRREKCRQRDNICRKRRGSDGHAAMIHCFAGFSALPIRIHKEFG